MNLQIPPIDEVQGKDPTVLESTRVRLNGMVRHNKVWKPLDCLSLQSYEDLQDTIANRQRVGIKLPGTLHIETRKYRNLYVPAQKAIDHYLSVHGVVIPRPEMEVVFGLTNSKDFQDYMAEIAMREGYDSWEDYHVWYLKNVLAKEPHRGAPIKSNEVWPVILSEFADEGIQDGSHRLHQYVEMGLETIPWIAFPNEVAQIKRVVSAWRLRATKVMAAHLNSETRCDKLMEQKTI